MKSLNQYIIEKILINKSSKLYKIKVESKDQLKSIIWERYINNISFVYLSDIDVSELDDLSGIFEILNNLEVVDISGWDTSNVIYMNDMFVECENIKKIIGIENLDVSKLRCANCMFSYCEKLVELDLTNWNPISLANMSHMFYNCSNLKIIKNIENWQLTNIKDVRQMFYKCAKLDVDLSNWDLSNIKDDFMKNRIVAKSGITKNHYPKLT